MKSMDSLYSVQQSENSIIANESNAKKINEIMFIQNAFCFQVISVKSTILLAYFTVHLVLFQINLNNTLV